MLRSSVLFALLSIFATVAASQQINLFSDDNEYLGCYTCSQYAMPYVMSMVLTVVVTQGTLFGMNTVATAANTLATVHGIHIAPLDQKWLIMQVTFTDGFQ